MNINKHSNDGVEGFILDQYDTWWNNRLPFQQKIQRNFNAFNTIDNVKGKKDETKGWRSDTYVRATKNKVVSGSNLVSDVMLANGALPHSLEVKKHLLPEEMDINVIEDDKRGMLAVMADQMFDGDTAKTFAYMALSGAEYGEAIGKKVVKQVEEVVFNQLSADVYAEKVKKKLIPALANVSVWDFFFDLEDDDLENNAGCIHRQLKSSNWLRQQKNKKYYIKKNIEKVLKSGKEKDGTDTLIATTDEKVSSLPPSLRHVDYRENGVLYIEFWGRVPKDKVELFEKEQKFQKKDVPYIGSVEPSDVGDDVEIMACVALADSGLAEVVKYGRIDKKQRPFMRAVWEYNPDTFHGIGVADNTEDMQNFLNWAVRAFEDNKKLSANVMLMVKARFFEKVPKEPYPGAVFQATEDCDDVRQGIQPIVVPDVGESLLSAIHMVALKFLDDDSLIPRIAQGMPSSGDKTAFEASVEVDKSGKYIGNVIKNFDEGIVEPFIKYVYEYNMKDPKIPYGKMNYRVKALGFKTYQDRVLKIQKWNQFLSMVYSNPAFAEHAEVRENLEEYTRIMGLDPSLALKDPREIAAGREQNKAVQEPLLQLDMAQKDADVKNTQADTMATIEGVKIDQAKVKIDRAETIDKIEKS